MATFEQFMKPVWDTDIMYYESLTMIADEDGKISAPLLYEPIEILAVQSATLEETYEEGRDWVWRDGKLELTEQTRIPYYTYKEFYRAHVSANWMGGSVLAGDGNYYYTAAGHDMHMRQIAVTYRCKCDWDGFRPTYACDDLPRFQRLLRSASRMNMVLLGDSISEGFNASGLTVCPPYLPTWGALAAESLRRRYGVFLDFRNPSIAGMNAKWGLENAERLIPQLMPDLVILAFGMNDGHLTPEEFRNQIAETMERIRAKRTETEFILVATSLPNPLLNHPEAPFWKNQELFGEALKPLCGKGVVMADVASLQRSLMKRKRYEDLTGNNINHPNDFFVRCHAQLLAAMLIEP